LGELIYFLADYYPWWGIPLALILAELANYHRRGAKKKKMITYASLSLVLVILSVLYFVFDGQRQMRPAIQEVERSFSSQKK
jgi:hypothetical protein